MRLYHHPMSSNARRAVLAAVHLHAPVELVRVDLFKGEHMAPGFVQINPNHKVPVLDDDGFVLWESHAIMQYLADKTPGQTLYPKALRARADVNRWLFWCAAHLMPAVGALNWENHIKGMLGLGAPDAAIVARGEEQLRELGAVLDAHLAQRAWISGDALTLADFSIAAPLADSARARLPVGDLQHVQRWFAAVRALEAWTSTEPQSPR
ncbi:MAG: glutathione S-transferase family protein [Betaproteobacteria bacterium]|nr:glutathione S-transferase family protein [Betaproteobacteria bacterium]MDE2124312.1 glutathione S-transferase family protein [Betaproteobacteria bacterium]MDE2186221.1 glutathione S-transferase family protein [Betaproteobacteria bacterium]MDE2326105.1 glutathione S-transferase family protein [Betaproteobacteria bacterium]